MAAHKIMEAIDNVKTKLTDAEYKKLAELCSEQHVEEKKQDEESLAFYEITVHSAHIHVPNKNDHWDSDSGTVAKLYAEMRVSKEIVRLNIDKAATMEVNIRGKGWWCLDTAREDIFGTISNQEWYQFCDKYPQQQGFVVVCNCGCQDENAVELHPKNYITQIQRV